MLDPQAIAETLRTFTALDWQRLHEACGEDDFASLAGYANLHRAFDGSEADRLHERAEELAERNNELRRQLRKYEPQRKPGVIGATIGLRSGRVFDYMNPTPDMIAIEDIAWGLAKTGRFANQLRGDLVYSVAQHSCLVAFVAPEEHRLSALLHDATEAYVGDMVGPLKQLCPEYRAVEDRVWAAIARRFDLPVELDPSIKIADLRALHTEKRAFSPDPREDWNGLKDYPPISLPTPISCWGVEQAALAFLSEFYRLSEERAAA